MDGLDGEGWMARRKEEEERYYNDLLRRSQGGQDASYCASGIRLRSSLYISKPVNECFKTS